jgi:hypothetical protein
MTRLALPSLDRRHSLSSSHYSGNVGSWGDRWAWRHCPRSSCFPNHIRSKACSAARFLFRFCAHLLHSSAGKQLLIGRFV